MDDVVDPIPTLLVLLAAAVACLVGARRLRALGLDDARADWSRPQGSPRAWALVGLASLLASWPILAGLGALLSADATLPGDASSHALAAQEIARRGLPHGWLDTHNGGYLFGPHYQPIPVLFVAALVKLGVPTKAAAQGTGVLAVVLLPPLFVAVARRAGARPLAALAGALLLAWASTFQSYVGGPRVYLSAGLLSQAFAAPIVLLAAACVITGRPRRAAPILGAIAVASHAQLALCALAAAPPALLATRAPGPRRRFALAAAGALAMGLAVYGPGARMLAVPFSWAKVLDINIVGYHPSRLPTWLLDGKLLDAARAPALTPLLLVAALVLLFTARAVAPRAALVLLSTVLALSVSGHALSALGTPGARLVEIFSPVRMLCLVPLAAAAALTVALGEVGARLEAALAAAGRRALWGPSAEAATLAAMTALAGVPTFRWLSARVAEERRRATHECQPGSGYRTSEVSNWIRDLRGGRLVVDLDSFQVPCPLLRGLELSSPVPTGAGMGGPGSQLGVNLLAFDELHASRQGGAGRAESLGVRWVLHTASHPPEPEDRFRVVASSGDVMLSERIGGTDRIGVGCVAARWRGDDRALRDALFEDLSGPHAVTADPEALTLIEAGTGPVVREAVPAGGCDARGARVEEKGREPGAYEAVVTAPSEVDLVVRATWVPTWRVTVDGVEVAAKRVAPGFFAVRVPAGVHRMEAVVGLPSGYGAGIAGAVAVVLALAAAARRVGAG